jgi:DNA-binding CsgD family transcriptional regulator
MLLATLLLMILLDMAFRWRLFISHSPAHADAPDPRASAALVGSGLAPREAAARLGIGGETARTALKWVFSKVGVSRQSELTALLTKLVLRQVSPPIWEVTGDVYFLILMRVFNEKIWGTHEDAIFGLRLSGLLELDRFDDGPRSIEQEKRTDKG